MSKAAPYLGWIKKAETFLEWKQFKQAIAAYEKAIKAKPNSVDAWMGLGRTHMDADNFESAIVPFQKAIKLEPKNFDAWFLLSTVFEDLGRNEDAVECFHTMTTTMADNPGSWFFYGMHLTRRDQHEEALEALNKAIAINPNPMFLMARNVTFQRLDRNEEALSDLDRLLTMGDAFVAWLDRAKLLEKMGRNDEALESYDHAIFSDQGNLGLWEEKIIFMEKIGQQQEALDLATKLTEALPEHPYTWWILGQALQRSAQFESAIASYARALDVEAENAEAHYELAKCYAKLGQNEPTIANLKKAIELNPDYLSEIDDEESFASLKDTEEFKTSAQQSI